MNMLKKPKIVATTSVKNLFQGGMLEVDSREIDTMVLLEIANEFMLKNKEQSERYHTIELGIDLEKMRFRSMFNLADLESIDELDAFVRLHELRILQMMKRNLEAIIVEVSDRETILLDEQDKYVNGNREER